MGFVPSVDGSQAAARIDIPDHQLLHCIGRGSYGAVWLARHSMGMLRAVKVVYRASFHDERPFERELSGIRKFEPISRSHEGFVDVLHVSLQREHGYFYYVMELGDDRRLGQAIEADAYSPKTLATELADRGKLSLAECIRLGLALSEALAALHDHGLVHRDIKPANVVYIGGWPKLADIGLVAEIQEATSYVGTEGFIPPEGPGTPAADVYGLGKVLYEAATGLDRKEFPALPEGWDHSPEHAGLLELNEILIQACAPQAAQRYRSARELHAELVILQNGASIKRLRLLERRLSALKRLGGIVALVLLVLGLVGGEVYRQWRLNIEAHEREVGANIAYGNGALNAGDFLGALPFFADALRLDQGQAQKEKNHRLRLGSLLAECPRLTQMWTVSNELAAGQLSLDGRLALVTEALVTEGRGKVWLYDVQSGQPLGPAFEAPGGLTDAVFSPDGRSVLTTSMQAQTLCLWDMTNHTQRWCLKSPSWLRTARFNRDGSRIVTAGWDGAARVWDASGLRPEPLLVLQGHTGPLRFAAFNHAGTVIVTTGEDHKAWLWDATTGAHLINKALQHQNAVRYAAFSPDDRRVVTASDDHRARLWDVTTGRQLLCDLEHEDMVRCAEFSPDGRMLLTTDMGGEVRFWDADSLQPLAANPMLRQGERVTQAHFSRDGYRVLVTCADGSVRLWDLAAGSPPLPAPGAYCKNGTRFLTFTNDRFQVWDAVSNTPVAPAVEYGALPRKPVLNNNGQYVLGLQVAGASTVTTNYIAQVWDVATGKSISPGIPLPSASMGLALSLDGAQLLTFDGPAAQLWDVRSGQRRFAPLARPGDVAAAVFSPNGRQLATRSGLGVLVWDTHTGRLAFPPLPHPTWAQAMEFSPDGKFLATCCSDPAFTKCYAQIWNLANGGTNGPPLRHGDGVRAIAFNADGSRLVTASEDFTAIVWDTRTGRRLTPPLRHHNQVLGAGFSPDAQWVVTSGPDSTARVWSADTGDPLSPPVRFPPSYLIRVMFLPDGQHVLTTSDSGQAWVATLPLDNRPVEDLVPMAHLLAGGQENGAPRYSITRTEPLLVTWERLRAKYPADFTFSSRAAEQWHELQAAENEASSHWSAAVFHLNWLLALRPDDSSLQARLARAREQMSRAD